jgi:hypothetical protein
MMGYRQKLGGSLRDYNQRFSQKCNELPKIYDVDGISAFWSGTTYRTLVQELSREQPKTTKELLDITTRHASIKEAVRAVFVQSSRKVAPGSGQGTSTTTTDNGTKRGIKSDRKGPRRWPQ